MKVIQPYISVQAMSYYPNKGCLKLSLEDGSDFTSCELRTLEKDSLDGGSGEFSALASAFRKKSECCRVILKSEHLKEAFQVLTSLHSILHPFGIGTQ